MFDAIKVGNLPPAAAAYAGYVNGKWQTFRLLQELFPQAHLLSIAVSADADAECLDVENLDATPSQAPAWVKRQQSRGVHRPVVYCSVSAVMDVLGHLASAGITRAQVRLWSAHYTQREHVCGPATCAYPGLITAVDGTQWTSRALGLDLDQSLLGDGFFAATPASHRYTEDSIMHAAITHGSPVVTTRWAGAAAAGLPPFFSEELFDLTGDTGAKVKVDCQAGGKTLESQTVTLTAGERAVVTPANGTVTLRFSRADDNPALAAALDVFRK